mgnify:CR=1 FL=1
MIGWLSPLILVLAALLGSWLDRHPPPRLAAPAAGEERLNPAVVRALAFGHLPAVTDWFLLRMLTNSDSAWVRPGELPSQYYDLKLASELDPFFYEIYTEGPRFLAVVRNDKEGSLELSLRGMAMQRGRLSEIPPNRQSDVWPSRFEIPFVLGYIYLFEQQNMPRAAEAFDEASKATEAPPYVKNLADRLRDPVRRIEVGIRILNAMMASEKDPQSKRKLEERRNSLYILDYLSALRSEFVGFLGRKPRYSQKIEIKTSDLKIWFAQYLRESHLDDRDPFGGRIFIGAQGTIQTTTPHLSVMGLE